jgi:hypothetical protein
LIIDDRVECLSDHDYLGIRLHSRFSKLSYFRINRIHIKVMKSIAIGTGQAGLPQAAVSIEYGHEVHAFEVDENRINAY